jgi:hypothetical protein
MLMKAFVNNCIIFCLLLLGIYVVVYWLYYRITLPENKNVVYIWGDSQMSQDLDLKYLNTGSHYQYRSAAQHGAGIYDFLVFTGSVPDYSNVLIQISYPVLLRRKEVDRNISALDFNSLNELSINHYSPQEIYTIIRKNILPTRLFVDCNYLFPNADTMTYNEPMSIFTYIYSKKPVYFDDKKNLYLYGIKNLIRKRCKITGIIFPYYPTLKKIHANAPYSRELAAFDKLISDCFTRNATIDIRSDSNLFYDLTHFNLRGAEYLSKAIVPYLDFKNESLLIKVQQPDL